MSKAKPANKMCLSILYRIEPGCLGPQGVDEVEDFAHVAQKYFNLTCADKISWQLVPRYNKRLPEFQYSVAGKGLDKHQATSVLEAYGLKLDEIEARFEDKLPELIDQFIESRKTRN